MTDEERKLLLMVAKDLRSLWENDPEMFSKHPTFLDDYRIQLLAPDKRKFYDRSIKIVESNTNENVENRYDDEVAF
jgi:hypothetical protein